ncbi:MAG: GNAT family N-acetyltransferase, partial [Muribaculaceae bacterium]|nr:GNAT family N-acetyltransferase [Muribaculaceae bacterium]
MDKINEIRRLWRERFNDSRNWMTNVFPRIYRDEEAMILPADNGNTLASMLLLRRYRMRYRNIEIPVGYIYGAATSRDMQGKGYMSRLVTEALREAYSRGDYAVALQPARRRLYGFYEKFGFATTFYIREQRYTAKHRFVHDESKYITEYSGHDAAELTAAFSRLTAGRESTILHTEDDFKTIIIDCELDEGCIATIRSVDTGDIVAMAYAVATADTVSVREIASLDEDAEAAVLDALSQHYPGRMTVVEAYPGQTNAIRIFSRGMARIVNVKAFIELLAQLSPDLRQCIRVSDPVIE